MIEYSILRLFVIKHFFIDLHLILIFYICFFNETSVFAVSMRVFNCVRWASEKIRVAEASALWRIRSLKSSNCRTCQCISSRSLGFSRVLGLFISFLICPHENESFFMIYLTVPGTARSAASEFRWSASRARCT